MRLKRPKRQRARPGWLWIPYLVSLLTFGLTLLSVYYFLMASRAYDQLRFTNQVRQTQDAIDARLETYIATLRGASGLFAASIEIERHEFRTYMERLNIAENYPGIQGIGFAQRVLPAERAALVANVRAQGFPDFQIWPAGERPEYFPVVFLEPQDRRNAAALGYDMFSEPVRRAAMERARDTGGPAASGKVTLVQEIDEAKQAGFLIYTPLYRGTGIPATTAGRQRDLIGFAYSPFRANDLLAGIFGAQQPQIAFTIFDGAAPSPEHLMYQSDPSSPQPGPASLRDTSSLQVAGRTWTIVYNSLPAFENPSARYAALGLLLAGTLASLALMSVIRAQVLARAQAEAAVRARDLFLSVASHELKSPLTALAGNAQLLLRRAGREASMPERDQRTVYTIAQQAHRLDKLITALLDHSRLQSGRLAIERAPVDLVELVRQVIEELEPTLSQHTVTFDPQAPALVVSGDALRLEQVVQNLLNNAVKYSPQGGPVTVLVTRAGESALLQVADAGIGIPEPALRRIFEQFYRAPNASAQDIGGIGIGLYLTHEIIELHGGSITVASAEGAGSTFTIHLPLDPAWLPAV